MSPRTLTRPPDDRSMWRRLLKRVHPDTGGDPELFVWANSVRALVMGGELEAPRRAHKSPAPGPDRVPFPDGLSFEDLRRRCRELADKVNPPFDMLLFTAAECPEVPFGKLHDQQQRGATYKQLALIGHLAGLSGEGRAKWYEIAEVVPLSQRHAGHIINRWQRSKRAA